MKSLFSSGQTGSFKYALHHLKFLSRTILILLVTLQSAFAQQNLLDKKLDLELKQLSISDALAVLSDQAGCTFSYNSTALPKGKIINLSRKNIKLSDALKEILSNKTERMQVQGNKILLVLKKGSGNIRGTVKTFDGQPAEFVSVGIRGVAGAVVDKNGEFQLKNIPEGRYTISASFIGLEAQNKQLKVIADEVVEVDFILSENRQQLNEVIVSGNKTNKFAEKESDQVARLPIKNLENPQVYSVVTQAIMKEQMLTTYAEAFQNVAGISTSNIVNTRGTSFFLRGFASPPSLRNGLVAPPFAESIEPVNIERVEVLKGPSATLFGSTLTSFGGAVNNVTKKPFAGKGGEVSYSLGSWDLSRLTLDYNMPVNQDSTLLFRVNAARHWANTFQDYGYQHSYAIAPSLLYKVNPRLTLLLEAEMNNYTGTMWYYASFGEDVTIKNIKDLKTPYNRSVAGNQLLQKWSSSSIFAKADYKISDQWTSSTNIIQSVYNRPEFYGMNNNVWINDSTIVRGIFGIKPQTFTAYQVQQNFTADFKIAKMRNRMVLGIDVFTNKQDGTFRNHPGDNHYLDTLIMNDPGSAVNISKEKVDAYFAPYKLNNYLIRSNTYSVYASDVINITDRLLAMLSLRVDRFDNKATRTNGVDAEDGAFKQTALSPKLGLVYQVIKDQVSIFGNYMNGFSNNAPDNSVQNQPVIYKPSQANQWETGIKMDVFQHKLSVNLSYYNISVKNALRYDVMPAIQDGTQYSRGFEAEIIANPVQGLNVVAGYGYNKSRYEKADEILEGKSLGAPENVANFWISYKLFNGPVKGLVFGFGGNYVGEVVINRPIIIPSYTLLSTSVSYDRPKYRIGFKVNNLGDQKYWSWDHITGQPPRNYVANISYKF